LSNRELLIFGWYQSNVKDIKCPLQWWGKHESMFSTISFLICQILNYHGVINSNNFIFLWLEYLQFFKNATYNQWAIFYKLIFVNEDWPIDPMNSCCSPSNLVQLIEINLNLEKRVWKCILNKMKLWKYDENKTTFFILIFFLLITIIFMI
jgi:hypothetical protein